MNFKIKFFGAGCNSQSAVKSASARSVDKVKFLDRRYSPDGKRVFWAKPFA